MRYPDGKLAKPGDHVRLGADDLGVVVCSIGSGEYTEEHLRGRWEYLSKGVVVEFPSYGLIHLVEPDEDLELIRRSD